MSRFLLTSLRFNMFFKYINLLLAIVSGVFLVPVYLKFLPVSEYGAWLAVASFAAWFTAIDPGIANLVIQKTSHSLGKGNKHSLSAFVVSGISLSLVASLLILSFGYILAPSIVDWMKITTVPSAQLITAFRMALGSVASMILAFSVIGVLQGLHKSISAGVIVTLSSLLKIVLSVCFFYLGYGFLSIPMAWVAASFATLIIAVLVLALSLRTHIDRLIVDGGLFREFASLFAYSFGGRLAKTISGSIDSVLIARVLGAEAVALYSLTATVPKQSENLVNQPVSSFRPAMAHLSASSDNDDVLNAVVRIISLIIWLNVWIALCLLCLNEDFIYLWVGSKGFAGSSVAIALALLFFVHVWSNTTGAISFSLGCIRSNSVIEWIYSLALIPAVITGLMLSGLVGVVIAHISVQLATMAWFYPLTIYRRLNVSPKQLRPVFVQLLASFVSASLASLANFTASSWLDLILAAISLSVAYFLLLGITSRLFRELMTVRSLSWLLYGHKARL